MQDPFKPIILTKKHAEKPSKSPHVNEEEIKLTVVSRKMGVAIQKARSKLKLSQKALANKMNKTESVVSDWESGKGVYDENLAKKIEDILGIKLSD